MIFKKLIFTLLAVAFCHMALAQNLACVNLRVSNYDAQIQSVVIAIGKQTVCINLKGRISLNQSEQEDNNYEYWDRFGGTYRNGKIKSMGNLQLDYYDQFAWDEIRGKVKSIGDVPVTYYDRFGWDETKGKVKSIGNITFTYYDRFDRDELEGKLKSIGNYKINYYTTFDMGNNSGKVKSIGNNTLTYFDSFSGEDSGKLQSIKGNAPKLLILADEY